MSEMRELFLLDCYLAREVAKVYAISGREAAIQWLKGFWYGTGVRRYDDTQKVAKVFGLDVRKGDLS